MGKGEQIGTDRTDIMRYHMSKSIKMSVGTVRGNKHQIKHKSIQYSSIEMSGKNIKVIKLTCHAEIEFGLRMTL